MYNVSWAIGREIYRTFEAGREAREVGCQEELVRLNHYVQYRILGLSESKLAWDSTNPDEMPITMALYQLMYVLEDALHNKSMDFDERWVELVEEVPEAGIQKWVATGVDERASAEVMSALEIMNVRSK